MSERVTQPSEASKTNWASGGSAYSNNDPGTGKRDVGFQPKDEPVPGPGEIIPAETHNFLWRLGMEMISWLRDYQIREWADVHEGVGGATYPEMFRVISGTSPPMPTMLAQIFSASSSAATGGSPAYICLDGEQIYYLSGSSLEVLIAASPADGSEIWEAAHGFTTFPFGLCADGNYLYATGDSSNPGLTKINRSTGAVVSSGGTSYNPFPGAVATNGVYAVAGRNQASNGNLVFYLVNTGTTAPTETGVASPGNAILAVALDYDAAYCGGTRSTYDVWSYSLSTRANNWQVTLPTSTAPQVEAIVADGDSVYVGTDNVALSAGGAASIFCLERVSGALRWTRDLNDIVDLAVDDEYLYAINTSDEMYVIHLRSSVATVVSLLTDVDTVVADGISVVCNDATTATDFQRNRTAVKNKLFQRADGADPNRKPAHLLAVPVP
jgi:hypothetical protein